MLLDFIVYGARPGDPPGMGEARPPSSRRDALLAAIQRHPGLSGGSLCRLVRIRRPEGLGLLRELCEDGLADFRTGSRGSRLWYPLPVAAGTR